MSRATKAAVAASLALLLAAAAAGCSDAQVAEAAQSRRYESEPIGTSWGLSISVVTDTETGHRWLVASMSSGGVAIEPMDGGDDHD